MLMTIWTEFIQPPLLIALTSMLAFFALKMKRLPDVLVAWAEHFAANAKSTPGFTDDIVGAALVLAAHAMAAAFGKPLPTELLPAGTPSTPSIAASTTGVARDAVDAAVAALPKESAKSVTAGSILAAKEANGTGKP